MKTLKQHTLIFDGECPMCSMYSSVLVKSGMMDPEDNQAYNEAAKQGLPNVDWRRARNEIALLNHRDNSVTYGVKSIVAILGNNSLALRWLFRIPLVHYLAEKLYFLISYNRRVIMPGKRSGSPDLCIPELNYPYRMAYIIATWLFTSVVLVYYSALLSPFIPDTNFAREFLVAGGPIIFQGILVSAIQKNKVIHYLGNMMTISFAGAILLTLPLCISALIHDKFFYLAWFVMVVGLMFIEHIRRVKILELPWLVSASWVVYRVIVLLIIL